MGKRAPTPPPAPDPTVVSQAQADANIRSAQEQQRLNMINTYGPQGSVTYGADPNVPGGYSQTTSLSPEEQRSYDLSKQAEHGALGLANDQIGRIGTALSTPLNTAGLPQLQGGPGQRSMAYEFNPGAPVQTSFNPGGQIQTSFNPGGQIQSDVAIRSGFDKGGPLQYSFDPGQQVQGQVGGDLNLQRLLGSEAVYQQAASRLDPRFNREQQSLETRLANQGLSVNSEAYRNAMEQFGQGKNDAYNQAIYSSIGAGENQANSLFQRQVAQGQFANQAAAQMYGQNMGAAQFNNATAGQEYAQNRGEAEFFNAANLAQMQARNQAQQQQYGQNMGAAQFGNAAQQQQYGQNMGAAQFNNAGAAQQFGQNATMAQFYNQAQNQGFNQSLASGQMDNQARQQGLQERAYLQNQPIDQFSALMSGTQVGMPQGVQYTPSQVGQTDVLGAYALNTQAQQAAYQQQMQNQQAGMSGLFQLGAAALMAPMTGGTSLGGMAASRLMGSDIRLKTDIRRVGTLENGVPVYSYRYKAGGPPMIGVMAHELAQVRPDAVYEVGGFGAVDYGAL